MVLAGLTFSSRAVLLAVAAAERAERVAHDPVHQARRDPVQVARGPAPALLGGLCGGVGVGRTPVSVVEAALGSGGSGGVGQQLEVKTSLGPGKFGLCARCVLVRYFGLK